MKKYRKPKIDIVEIDASVFISSSLSVDDDGDAIFDFNDLWGVV